MRVTAILTTLLLTALAPAARGETPATGPAPVGASWAVRMADAVMARHPDPGTIDLGPREREPAWDYAAAFAVHAVGQVGARTGDAKYVDYARRYMDLFVDEAGRITTASYDPKKYRLDDVEPGRILQMLHRQTGEERWLTASRTLAEQLRTQPRTSDGGFWHKEIYPHQMWLDGIFMDCPFMAEHGRVTNDPKWLDEAVHQIVTIARHTRDPETGLYYHGWDESRSQFWADKSTGLSANFWGRAVGWYVMGIVDTLEHLPADHPRRGEVLEILRGLADAIARVQDPKTGVWYQVLDQPDRAGNYLESSASCMFVYALAKAQRLGLLDATHADVVRRGYDGILTQFIEVDDRGLATLTDTCQVAGLGGRQRRDGSFDYYMSEPRISNDPKGVAPFILASLEIETASATPRPAH